LAIAPWVNNRSITDVDVDVIIVLLEYFALELWTMICDDLIRDPKAASDGFEELDSRGLIDGGDSGCLRPLGELINGNI
jgi:uncharacterized protein YutE (UPF0331/DUF86 family)